MKNEDAKETLRLAARLARSVAGTLDAAAEGAADAERFGAALVALRVLGDGAESLAVHGRAATQDRRR